MAVLNSTLRVSLKDLASGPAKRITGALKSLQKAGSGMAVGNQMAVQSRKMGKAVRRMNASGGMAGMGATMAAGAFLRNESQVQSSMNMTQAILNATTSEFQEHRKEVVRLAKAYPTTRNEIAKGAQELAMSGMNLKQVNKVLEATVQGSMASGESIKTVGQGVTDVIMGLGKDLTKGEFMKINNVLVSASTSYAQGYKPFLDGLAKTAPLARMQGMAIERLAGMLGILADAGFKGAKGGTALKTSMINAAAPTKTAIDLLKSKGIVLSDFRKHVDKFQLGGKQGANSLSGYIADALNIDAKGANLGKILAPILNDKNAFDNIPALKKRLSGAIRDALNVTDIEGKEKIGQSVNRFMEAGFQSLDFEGLMRAMAEKGLDKSELIMKEVFGKRFVAQMAALINSMNKVDGKPGAFDKKMNDIFLPRIEGAVARFAKILMQGLPGALKKLGGAFDGLMDAMAKSGAIDVVVKALERLKNGILWLGERSPGLLKAITLIGLSAGLLMPLGLALSSMGALLTVVTAGAGLARIALLGMGRAALIGTAGLAIGGLKTAWLGLAGVVGKAAKAVALFKVASSFGGARVGLAFLALNGAGGLAKMSAGLGAMLNPMNLLRTAARGVGVALRFAFIATGVGAAIAVIAAAGALIYNNWTGIKEMFSGIGEGFREALGPSTMAVFDKIGSAIGKVVGWLTDLVGPLDASKKKWRDWGKTIGAAIAWPIKQIGKLLGLVSKMGKWIASSRIGQWVAKKMGMGSEKTTASPAKKMVAAVSEPVKPVLKPAVAKTAAPVTAAPVTAPVTPAANIAGSIASLSQIEAKANGTVGVVRNAMAQIQSAASIDLTQKGMNIMNTLAAGMRARAGAAVAEMRRVAQQLRDHLPSSPAKTGPLSDIHKLKFGETIAQSIKAEPMVRAMRKAAAQTRSAAGQAGAIQVRPLAMTSKAALAASVGAQMAMAGPAGVNSVGDIHVSVHIPAGVSDNATIGEEVGRKVRNAVSEAYSDGGI